MVEREAVRAAGDFAGGLAPGDHRLTVAGDRPALELDPHEPPRGMLGIQPGQGGAADEIALLELDGPSEGAAVRVGVVVHVLAVEAQPRLEAQRVARAEAARDQSVARAGFQERVPEGRCVRRVDVQLEAILPRVAGPRYRRP